MKSLLWCMGWPAPYFRRLHKEIDLIPGLSKNYLYYPYDESLMKERSYEEGDLSPNAIVVNRATRKNANSLISKCMHDQNSVLVVCGTYPRTLLPIIYKLKNASCRTYYFSDDNIFARMPGSFVSRNFHRLVLNSFKGYLQIGTANACYQSAILGKEKVSKRHIVHFPYPHFCDEVISDQKNICPDDIVRFLYLGRVISVKNVPVIIEAAGILSKKGINNFTIEIAGDGDCIGNVKLAIGKYHFEDKVTLSGLIKTNNRREVYARNDVFILPSHVEPWGLVINEALSAGLPVITPYWTGAAVDLISNGITGFKINANDPNSIAKAMSAYCNNQGLIKKQSKFTSIYLKERNFTHEACIDAIREICS